MSTVPAPSPPSSSSPRSSRPSLDAPPEAWSPLVRAARTVRRPLERFLAVEAASGVLLLVAAAVALAIASSPLAPAWAALWELPLGLRLGTFTFERSLAWVVNDGLMTIFFFVVGLEMRREIHQGELSEPRRAALPLVAALGGMVVPALVYVVAIGAHPARGAWGVPMATDIAFALGVLALLGKRVPPALRVLLLALAVVDDLGAILVIAFVYSSGVSLPGLAVAGAGLALVLLLQRFGARRKLLYVLPGLVAWGGTYAAGIHPTLAGVVLGLLTPVRAWREPVSPAEGLIDALHPWVAFVIMPVFALANAGVRLGGGAEGGGATSWPVVAAVVVGLAVGKPLGVVGLTWVALRAKFCTLPAGLGLRHLGVLGAVAGIGFTMAIFVAGLALDDAAHLASAKVGVLLASGLAAAVTLVGGRFGLPATVDPAAAACADEAEASTER